jgi:Protein of unknown function (DUF995)
MLRSSSALALFVVAPLAIAQMQSPSLTALKAMNAVQLSAEDLQQLIPSAKVVSYTSAGSTRRWTNKADGTLSASSDGRGSNGGRGYPSSAEGTWKLDGTGKWCVKIQWSGPRDDWCRYLFKADGKYYAYGSLQDDAPGSAFEISH